MNNWYFASGDLGFFWDEQVRAFSWLPQVFQKDQGFGFNGLLSLWLDYPFRVTVKLLSTLGLSWFFIEKVLWLSVFFLAIYSSYRLASYLLEKSPFRYISSFIYSTNTYFLLLFGGGQLGIALAYAFSPFVVFRFMKYQTTSIRGQVVNGLCLALLITFDLRIAYLVLAATIMWWIRRPLFLLAAASVHLFWILPTALASRGTATLGEEFTNAGMLKFLSFADFSHTLALLHPNWPENLFGKVYFFQSEFLILPLLAFGALAINRQKTINNKQDNRLLLTVYCPYFALLALIGAFFAKGVNEPFGGIFQWMFERVPGFVMFRDPTKFYLYIALGYSILIPLTLEKITSYGLRVTGRKPIVSIIFAIFWVFTIRSVFTGEVRGNLRPVQLPKEYVALKDMLVSDREPSRTLWIPKKENFAFASDIHPLLSSDNLFANTSVSAVIATTKTPAFMEKISDAGVKYIIVPIDVEKRMFLDDYKPVPRLRDALIRALGDTALTRDANFKDIAVFANDQFTFTQDVPPIVARQQVFANVGAVASVIFLLGWMGTLWRKREWQ